MTPIGPDNPSFEGNKPLSDDLTHDQTPISAGQARMDISGTRRCPVVPSRADRRTASRVPVGLGGCGLKSEWQLQTAAAIWTGTPSRGTPALRYNLSTSAALWERTPRRWVGHFGAVRRASSVVLRHQLTHRRWRSCLPVHAHLQQPGSQVTAAADQRPAAATMRVFWAIVAVAGHTGRVAPTKIRPPKDAPRVAGKGSARTSAPV